MIVVFILAFFFAFFSLHATTFTVAADRDHFLYNKFLFIFYTTQRYRVLCVDASVCNILIFGLSDRFQSRTKYLKYGEKWVYYFTSEMGESWPEKTILVTSEHVIMDKTWVNYFTSDWNGRYVFRVYDLSSLNICVRITL